MPAPAMSSRHLYTGHRRGHIQPAPRLRAHRGEPLSRDHPQIPVSMPSLFRFDASAVVHTCSSSHRTPAPLTARRQPQRSPPRLLTDAACGGLESPPARRPRRTYLHHWHSTDRADDLLHRHHFPSGHTWVPKIWSCALTRHDALASWGPMCRILYRFRRVAGTAGGASRALEGPRDHRPTAPVRRAAPPQQPTAAGRRGPDPAWCCRGGPAPTAASRLARHVGDLVALAPAANRQTLDPTLGNAGPTIHLRLASSSHPRNGQRQPHLGLPPNHRRARGPRLPRWRGGQEAWEPDRSPSSHPTPPSGPGCWPQFQQVSQWSLVGESTQ